MSKMRLLKILGSAVIAIPIIGFVVLVMSRPERASMQLLKIGGRMIKRAVDNVEGVAIGLTLAVVLLWGIIMLACWLQSDSQQTPPPKQNT